ncbi:hypothetical protein [Paludisphaera sp.]|uniref:hypothetical protein n=1 Tax=Paludisphaera sp. TaxID=2017432 RepID=UPI00301C54C8
MTVVGGNISQFVQFTQVGDSRRVAGIGARKIKGKSEALEVLANIFEVRVALVQLPVGRKLLLKKNFDRRILDPPREDHRAFRVKVAAEALEMGGKEHDQPAEILIFELRVWGGQRRGRRALLLQLGDPGKPVSPPDAE